MKFTLPNYNECLTNLACTIMKYFEVEYEHDVIKEIDDILNKNKPENVIVMLYDGMGTNILKRYLAENAFLRTNLLKSISSVAPSTTTAATTSVLSGLNPCEHGWLGWDLYIEPLDKIVSLFKNTEKDTDNIVADYSVAQKYFGYKNIPEKINEAGKYYSKTFFSFKENDFKDLDDLNSKIMAECQKAGKKFIYAYYDEPDHSMHNYGTDSKETLDMLQYINAKSEELCQKLNNTVVIIIADHGHLNCEDILLSQYEDVLETLDGDVWIEGRLCTFRVKKGKEKEFERLFDKYFKEYFILKTKEEVINEKIFGFGNQHTLFGSSLGDYFALGIANKYFRYSDASHEAVSMHAGFTEDEMLVPLIVVTNNSKRKGVF